MAIHSLQEFI